MLPLGSRVEGDRWVWEKGKGSARDAGEDGVRSGMTKVAGKGRKGEKLCNFVPYFAIKTMQSGGTQPIQGGNRD